MGISLNVCMITNNYTPYSGGVVSSIKSHKQELENLGHKVKIVTLDFLNSDVKDIEENVIRLSCPLKLKYYNNPIAFPLCPDKQILKIIEKLNPNIIHTHHPFLLGSSALKASKILDIPLIFTYHTIYEKFLHYIPIPKLILEPLIKTIVKSFCSEVKNIIVPSSSILEYIKTNNIISSQNKIKIIPSGILNIFKKENFEYKSLSNKFKLLTVSRFAKEKNIDFLIKAFSKLDQNIFEFTLVGYGPELESLQHYAYNKLKLNNKNIKFIIKPDKQDLVKLYDKSDLFLFASQNETQGLVLAESMARGTPIVALTGSGIYDIIDTNYNGFIVNNITEMILTINFIKNNIVLFKNLQYNSWNTGKNYWPESCTQKLINFYLKQIKNIKREI